MTKRLISSAQKANNSKGVKSRGERDVGEDGCRRGTGGGGGVGTSMEKTEDVIDRSFDFASNFFGVPLLLQMHLGL